MVCPLFPACTVSRNGIMYYVTHIEHAIKELDLNNLKTRYIDNPEKYVSAESNGIDKIVIHNNNLYLFEQSGKWILEYSISNKTSRFFDLRYSMHNMHNCDNWAICTVYKDILYVFPCYANNLIKIDLKKGILEIEKELYPDMDYEYMQEKGSIVSKGIEIDIPYKLYSCGCQFEDEVWIFTERKNIVLKYNLLTETRRLYLLPERIDGCTYAAWKEGLFYILSIDGNVYCWNPEGGETEILFDGKKRYPFPYFGKIAVTDISIWLMPCFGENILVIDRKNGKEKTYTRYPENFIYCEEPYMSKYFGNFEDDKNYYFAMHCANYILIIEKESGKEKWIQPIEPDLNEKINYYLGCNLQKYEESDFGLKGFLLLLNQSRWISEHKKNKKVDDIIWNILRGK